MQSFAVIGLVGIESACVSFTSHDLYISQFALNQRVAKQSDQYRLATAKYHEAVVDHYENPRNVGSLDKSKTNGYWFVEYPACGDVMKLQIE